MDTVGTHYTVEQDETRLSADKQTSVEFRAGQRIPTAEAIRFGFLAGVTAFVGARLADEVPAIAPTELEQRGLPPAPENRMEPSAAPENRGTVAEADYPVWYREHVEKAGEDGAVAPLLRGETRAAYFQRTGQSDGGAS